MGVSFAGMDPREARAHTFEGLLTSHHLLRVGKIVFPGTTYTHTLCAEHALPFYKIRRKKRKDGKPKI
jgi:hypothetical protein